MPRISVRAGHSLPRTFASDLAHNPSGLTDGARFELARAVTPHTLSRRLGCPTKSGVVLLFIELPARSARLPGIYGGCCRPESTPQPTPSFPTSSNLPAQTRDLGSMREACPA